METELPLTDDQIINENSDLFGTSKGISVKAKKISLDWLAKNWA
jgi:hypothetical protein